MDWNNGNATAPEILVQIVHIEGPSKGKIEEFTKDRIFIGRATTSDVLFPSDLRIVSRNHAEINREGNRFHLVNRSPNGCFVNGHQVEDTYLKQGDVIAFAEGGPKVSFLMSTQPASRPRPAAPAPPPPPPPPSYRAEAPAPRQPQRPAPAPVRAAPESAAFTIQYGTVIRSFKQPSVKFGRDASADFSFPDPRVFGNHAEVFFRQGQYFLRDLTESHATLLNGRPLAGDTPLQDNDVLELNEAGPRLRYLGAGRFAELLETRPEPPPSQPLESSPPEASPAAAGSLAGKVRSLFRR